METDYRDGDVVWVKCGPLFWPAVVVDFNKLPPEVKEDFPVGSTKPLIVTKFFNEDGYEFLFDTKNIRAYNCSEKVSYITKGLAKSRSKSKEGAKNSWFTKFPENVIASERLIGGDVRILEKEPFAEKQSKKIDYKAIFGGTPKPAPKSSEKAPKNAKEKKEEKKPVSTTSKSFSSPRDANGQKTLSCSYCNFVTTSISLLIIHNKGHSSGNIPINKKSNNGPPCKSKSTEKKQVKSSKPVSASLTNNSSNKLGVTPKRGRGRPPRSSVNALTPNEIVTPSPGRGRKPYMTKKVKEAIEQEKERKAEERNKILMDWSDDDEEHGERSSRRVESDNGSDGSDAEAEQDYFGDDNVHGYDDDDDDEEEVEEALEETTLESKNLSAANGGEKSEPISASNTSNDENVDAVHEDLAPANLQKVETDFDFDIDKILEETAVPSLLPSLEKVAKKSVKFSPVISREMSIKTIRVIEPESNLAEPEDVIDEFDFTEDSEFSETKAPRTILKRASSSSGNDEITKRLCIEDNAASPPPSVEDEPTLENDLKISNEISDKTNESAFPDSVVLQTEQGQQTQVSNGGDSAPSEETFFLVVDDESGNSNLDALNSQTLYIDSKSLENGDLSNMLLLANGVQEENQAVSVSSETSIQAPAEQESTQQINQSQ